MKSVAVVKSVAIVHDWSRTVAVVKSVAVVKAVAVVHDWSGSEVRSGSPVRSYST